MPDFIIGPSLLFMHVNMDWSPGRYDFDPVKRCSQVILLCKFVVLNEANINKSACDIKGLYREVFSVLETENVDVNTCTCKAPKRSGFMLLLSTSAKKLQNTQHSDFLQRHQI